MGKRGKPLVTASYPTVAVGSSHPLAHADGRVRIHRLILFEKIGPGVHLCHWGPHEIEWMAAGDRELIADHVDGDTWNNDPENLVPSCFGCNAARHKRDATRCSVGHEYTDENTYIRPDTGTRMCRACARERDKKRRPRT